ncbi:haloacid dehalogenase type II [Alkalicoccus saliphilus]|uniref:Haloacid dehalogenase type II n=1 Tax=Alkalicoccus saliphilus TaxID=200989 RepID=A0A2T4U6N0_9BACI|nr:haloacid dehalogenase type II [Alkalicoccus saliphilus]PTL39063.1 haloacid dehalogenase type II [Alkalicoccus saliphilus]
MTTNKTFVFDVYGTLFDVHSIGKACETYFPGKGESISETWRQKQIQYTFLRQAMGKYAPFSEVTRDALRFAADLHGRPLSLKEEDRLLEAYQSLSLFPESLEVLSHLKEKGHTLIIFSNGDPLMLHPLLKKAQITNYIDHILSVDTVKQYKPTPAAYHLILDTIEEPRSDIVFLSSNGWDISGAKAFGFTTAWINRSAQPVEGLHQPPHYEYSTLNPLPTW